MQTINLNDVSLINNLEMLIDIQRTPSVTSGQTIAYFNNLELRLINHIQEAEEVVGCVAWFTAEPIINALAQKDSVSILIQKEDFLRPDLSAPHSSKKWSKHLRSLYTSLPQRYMRHAIHGDLVQWLSFASGDVFEAVRCVGMSGKDSNRPRMHHKFLVFCRIELDEPAFQQAIETYHEYVKTNPDEWEIVEGFEGIPGYPPPRKWQFEHAVPYAVWTGSFNLSAMASSSLENALYIEDEAIAAQYYKEWEYVFALSEPLDWETKYCKPEYRIGT
jgi:hypothetical protein